MPINVNVNFNNKRQKQKPKGKGKSKNKSKNKGEKEEGTISKVGKLIGNTALKPLKFASSMALSQTLKETPELGIITNALSGLLGEISEAFTTRKEGEGKNGASGGPNGALSNKSFLEYVKMHFKNQQSEIAVLKNIYKINSEQSKTLKETKSLIMVMNGNVNSQLGNMSTALEDILIETKTISSLIAKMTKTSNKSIGSTRGNFRKDLNAKKAEKFEQMVAASKDPTLKDIEDSTKVGGNDNERGKNNANDDSKDETVLAQFFKHIPELAEDFGLLATAMAGGKGLIALFGELATVLAPVLALFAGYKAGQEIAKAVVPQNVPQNGVTADMSKDDAQKAVLTNANETVDEQKRRDIKNQSLGRDPNSRFTKLENKAEDMVSGVKNVWTGTKNNYLDLFGIDHDKSGLSERGVNEQQKNRLNLLDKGQLEDRLKSSNANPSMPVLTPDLKSSSKTMEKAANIMAQEKMARTMDNNQSSQPIVVHAPSQVDNSSADNRQSTTVVNNLGNTRGDWLKNWLMANTNLY